MLEQFLNWLSYNPATATGIQLGALAGLIFFLGVLLITRIKKSAWQWAAAASLLVLITPLAIGGFWWSEGPLGISDWDYYFSLHTVERNTLLQYHQLPHWNPYICGGTAGLADPEFRFFTPTFLLQLLFGVPAGLRLSTFLMTATGAIGVLFLGKRLHLSVYGALLAAIGYGFGGINIIEMVEGHPNIFAAMYIPWIFWAWLAAYRKSQSSSSKWSLGNWPLVRQWANSNFNYWHLVTGIFLALTFFQGGIYLLMYTAIAFIGLFFLVSKPWQAAKTTIYSGLWALGFASVKLIPVFYWLRQFQDEHYVSSANFLPYLHKVLLTRLFHGAGEIIPNQASGWHEYGAYIGPVIIILAIVGLISNYRRRIPHALCIAVIAATLVAASGPLLKPLFDQVSFIPRSNISRFMLFAVFPLSLLAGYGIDAIKKYKKLLPVALFLLGLTALDLMTFAYPLSQQAFVLPRAVHPIAPAPYPIAYNAIRYEHEYFPSDEARREGASHRYSRAYEATLKGYGTMTYCSVLTPPRAVRTIHDEGPVSILDFDKTSGTFTINDWTPNKITLTVNAAGTGNILLNANYAKGWHYQIDEEPPELAHEIGNRVGAPITANQHLVIFFYKSPGFILGSIISLITLSVALLLLINHRYLFDFKKPSQQNQH